jgi:sortase A
VRPAVSVVAVVLFVAGGLAIVYPVVTHLYAGYLQSDLEEWFGGGEGEAVSTGEGGAGADEGVAFDPAAAGEGGPVTRLVIPALEVDTVVVEGVSPSALRAGAGHYPDTPLPGERGNVAIAGHRTTYGAPLRHADQLTPGDEIRLQTPQETHVYEVAPPPAEAGQPCPRGGCWITDAGDWSVVEPLQGRYLTLTTCHPVGSDAQRLIVRAELTDA